MFGYQRSFACIVLLFIISYLDGSVGNAIGNEVIADQELVFAIVVNRHGERTPDADELSLSNIKEKLRNLTDVDGLESLTNIGKRRAYQIGKFIRQRYGSQGQNLLSNLYIPDEILVRSTDKERTKMTAQVAMAAVYPPEVEQQWDEGVGKVWQPVPYTAVPLSEDYLRYYSNCERFKTLMAAAKQDALHQEFAAYDDLVPMLKARTGRNFTENILLFETLFDLFHSQVGLGLDIPDWSKPLLPRLSEAANLAYKLYFRNDEMKKIGGGVLLSMFIEAGKDISAGTKVPKRLRLFSSHDFNIGAFMRVSKVKTNYSIPEYGAIFALELYKSRSKGDLSVLPVYLPQAGETTAKLLHFEGCESDDYCDFSKFEEITKEFLLPEQEYYKICNIRTEL
ncbi:venom acid phosphatase Acph-1-like [Achroia grisella]|uniref:venom acid phosphatase Acph-1-like n=1 Tax=Achroia grisella TaxID=688607 RepID=UPI0027D2D1FF|nr:venom acid phosphatase Acph-1-like [Achroia grisella]XP_059061098.1 venom acid phosphatase Acph-1-like [Achroia grisella]XP_059061099.1 venom acid phosphatase Acph-1-like [Achroia grisella]